MLPDKTRPNPALQLATAALLRCGALLFLLSQTGCIGFRDTGATDPVPEPAIVSGLEQVWSVSIGSNRLAGGVAADPVKGVIYAISPAFKAQEFKTCVQISPNGEVEKQFRYQIANGNLRSAQLRSEAPRDLVFYNLPWGHDLTATDANGTTLWTYEVRNGIDDLWIADLDRDGLDEVIIGYNGSTGLHVLDGRGKLLWKNRQIGNVWSVGAADLDGDGKTEVLGTSSRGWVHVFKSDGTRRLDLQPPPGYYVGCVRPVKLADSGRLEGILVTGGKGRVAGLKGNGTLAWEAPHGTPAAGGFAEPAPGKLWLALASRSLVVLDTRNGSTIAELKPGESEICWLDVKGQNSPLLIVSTRQRIYAYRVRE